MPTALDRLRGIAQSPRAMSDLRNAIGVLRETKNRWERRVPLVPADVPFLRAAGVEVRVERSDTRVFTEAEYTAAGAVMVDDVSDCALVIGVKEVHPERVRPGQTVMCFSHTIKGQAHNMPLLGSFIAIGATLVDYEVIVDDRGARQVAFGRYAGLAGAHETLWTLGHRVGALGHPNALTSLTHAVEHPSLAAMVLSTRTALAALSAGPQVPALSPLTVVVTGNGRVSTGALEYLDAVGGRRLTVDEAVALQRERRSTHELGILHLAGADLYRRAGRDFDFDDYLHHPTEYLCVGAMYLPYGRAVINGLYWDVRFPRLLDDSTLRRMYANKTLPVAIGDVACDLRGGVEWTVVATEPDAPAFVYNPEGDRPHVGVEGPGVAIMSVDNLPCALPRDASEDFSRSLQPYLLPCLHAHLDRGAIGELPPSLQPAVVVAGGKLTDRHAGLAAHLAAAGVPTGNPRRQGL